MSPGLRFVTTLHGTDITVVGADRTYARPTRFAIEQSDAVTAVSAFLAEETSLQFGIRRHIHVVPNFVNTDTYRPQGAGAAAPARRTNTARLREPGGRGRPGRREGGLGAGVGVHARHAEVR